MRGQAIELCPKAVRAIELLARWVVKTSGRRNEARPHALAMGVLDLLDSKKPGPELTGAAKDFTGGSFSAETLIALEEDPDFFRGRMSQEERDELAREIFIEPGPDRDPRTGDVYGELS
jgi:hypothetical protein